MEKCGKGQEKCKKKCKKSVPQFGYWKSVVKLRKKYGGEMWKKCEKVWKKCGKSV